MVQLEKAYTELYEILKHLSVKDRIMIPIEFEEKIKNNMDKSYKYQYDNSKSLLEQDLMYETKIMIIEVYKRYLAPNEEQSILKKIIEELEIDATKV